MVPGIYRKTTCRIHASTRAHTYVNTSTHAQTNSKRTVRLHELVSFAFMTHILTNQSSLLHTRYLVWSTTVRRLYVPTRLKLYGIPQAVHLWSLERNQKNICLSVCPHDEGHSTTMVIYGQIPFETVTTPMPHASGRSPRGWMRSSQSNPHLIDRAPCAWTYQS